MAGLGQARPRGVGPVDHGGALVDVALPEDGVVGRQALLLLRERKLAPQSVVRVDPYAIAFTNRCGKVRTAWTFAEKLPNGTERLRVTVESGLPAFPTEAARSA